MTRRLAVIGCGALLTLGGAAAASRMEAAQDQQKQGASASGWQLPADADTKTSPLQVDAKVLATGKSVFKDKCTKCHGPGGLGDGPDADPEHREDMIVALSFKCQLSVFGASACARFFDRWYLIATSSTDPRVPSVFSSLRRRRALR